MQANQSLCVCCSEELGARRNCPKPQPPVYFLRLYIINRFGDACSSVFREQQAQGTALSDSVLWLGAQPCPRPSPRPGDPRCSPPVPRVMAEEQQLLLPAVGLQWVPGARAVCLSVPAVCPGRLFCGTGLSRTQAVPVLPRHHGSGLAVGRARRLPGCCAAAGAGLARCDTESYPAVQTSFLPPAVHALRSTRAGSREEFGGKLL